MIDFWGEEGERESVRRGGKVDFRERGQQGREKEMLQMIVTYFRVGHRVDNRSVSIISQFYRYRSFRILIRWYFFLLS